MTDSPSSERECPRCRALPKYTIPDPEPTDECVECGEPSVGKYCEPCRKIVARRAQRKSVERRRREPTPDIARAKVAFNDRW